MKTYLITDIETTGLDPSINGRVTCISTYNMSNNQVVSFVDKDESLVINQYWEYVNSLNVPTLVTFNGTSFDLPYLVHRSIVRGIRISKYTQIDLRQIANSFFLSYEKRVKGSLGYWASVLGIEQKTPDGFEMVRLFAEGRLDEIKKHCEEDISITKKLFERLQMCGLISEN
jgi:uncharacterized protein YprB with RNaseH-like and TPR domain